MSFSFKPGVSSSSKPTEHQAGITKPYDTRGSHYDVCVAAEIAATNAHIDAIAKPVIGQDRHRFKLLIWPLLDIGTMVRIIDHFPLTFEHSTCQLNVRTNSVRLRIHTRHGDWYNLQFKLAKRLFERLMSPCPENTANPARCSIERFIKFIREEHFLSKLNALNKVLQS